MHRIEATNTQHIANKIKWTGNTIAHASWIKQINSRLPMQKIFHSQYQAIVVMALSAYMCAEPIYQSESKTNIVYTISFHRVVIAGFGEITNHS